MSRKRVTRRCDPVPALGPSPNARGRVGALWGVSKNRAPTRFADRRRRCTGDADVPRGCGRWIEERQTTDGDAADAPSVSVGEAWNERGVSAGEELRKAL